MVFFIKRYTLPRSIVRVQSNHRNNVRFIWELHQIIIVKEFMYPFYAFLPVNEG